LIIDYSCLLEHRCKTDIWIATARWCRVGSTTTSLATGLLSNSIQTVFVNVLCLSSALPSLHQQHGSVCRHFYSPPGTCPTYVIPNSYKPWGACILSSGTCSMERTASQYPQHCRFKTIQM